MNARIADTALLIALACSLGLNLVQMRTVTRLRAADAVAAGARMPSLSVVDTAGRRSDLALTGDLPTVLYVFSPQCGWCDANRAGIDALASQLRGRYRVIGVSLTDRDLETWLRARPPSFPIYHSPAPAAHAAYRLETTPQTILVSSDGVVARVWQGAYAGRQQAAIEAWFGVTLPVLTMADAATRR